MAAARAARPTRVQARRRAGSTLSPITTRPCRESWGFR
jgi:hypothetical protein